MKSKMSKTPAKKTAKQDVKKAVAITNSKKFAPITPTSTKKVYPENKRTNVVDSGYLGKGQGVGAKLKNKNKTK